MEYLLLLVGFVFLIVGADILVSGAASIARRFGIPPLVIGLTIVAFGTSAPELFINVTASLKGSAGIAFGNIVGSNIANILLILGVAVMIRPLEVQKTTVKKEIPLVSLASIVLFVLANDALIEKESFSAITRSDGLVLIGFFMIFLYYAFEVATNSELNTDDNLEEKVHPLGKAFLLMLVGIAGLAIGGDWIVKSATTIAKDYGLSETTIGLTIVAVGTSLPELATTISATLKKKTDIAIGNAVGSNIFNIFWVMGVSSIIKNVPFDPDKNLDLLLCVISSVLLFAFLFFSKKHILKSWQGVIFLVLYISYITFTFLTA